MKVVKNVALRPLMRLTDNDGWETSAAQAFKTLLFTSNFFAAYSDDNALTFHRISPYKLTASVGHVFSGDQHAIYVPAANVIVWTLLADAGPVLMCLATPDEIGTSKGAAWTVYVLDGPVFHRERTTLFDYPQVSFGDNFLYITFNIIDTGDAIACRFDIAQLRRRGTLSFQYFVAINNNWLCPCQLSGGQGYFVRQNKTSQLRIFAWSEVTGKIQLHDVNISTIPTEDFVVTLPDGGQWLTPGEKIDSLVVTAARRRNELWVAWSGARRVLNQHQNSFPYPHIGVAMISLQSFSLVGQRYLWNNEHAFAYPSLATNPAGEIALTFSWGGGDRHYVQHGVGFLTGTQELQSTTSDNGKTGGLHYLTARMAFPEIDRFFAAGWNSPADPTKPGGRRNEPRYVLFER